MMKTSSKKRFPHGVWGSNLQVFIFIKKEHPRKVFPLLKNKTVYIKFKWDAQGKGMLLIWLSFFRSRVVSWETGFRIDSRSIKRGSRVSISIISFGESSNLCILASSFLVLIWFLSMRGFIACVNLHYKLKFIKYRFRMHSLLRFRFGGFIDVSFIDMLTPSSFDSILPCCTMIVPGIILYILFSSSKRA